MSLTKDEYLKSARRLSTGYGPTADFADANVGTTVQTEGGIGDRAEDLPGQVFSVDQLPDPEVARAYGLPSVVVPEHLIVDTTKDAEKHLQGKTADDIANAKLRRELGDPVIAYNGDIVSAKDSLKGFDELAESRNDRLKDSDSGTQKTDHGHPVDPAGVQKADGAKVAAKDGGKAGNPV